jgi:hypothetical protein
MDMDSNWTIIDRLEELIQTCGWEYARVAAQVINFKRVGAWHEYGFYVAEQSSGAVLVTGSFELRLAKKDKKIQIKRVYKLLNLFHEDVPLGTFSLNMNKKTGVPTITWTYQFFRAQESDDDDSILERVLNEALLEIEEMYPSFQRVILPGITVQQAYDLALPEVYGRA